MEFKFAGTQKMYDESGSFMYQGVDLMAHQYQWESITNEFPRLHLIIDNNGTVFKPAIYKLEMNDKFLIFASGEITNGIWGFALPEE